VINDYIVSWVPVIRSYSSSILKRSKRKLIPAPPCPHPEKQPYKELITYLKSNFTAELMEKENGEETQDYSSLMREIEEYDTITSEIDTIALRELGKWFPFPYFSLMLL